MKSLKRLKNCSKQEEGGQIKIKPDRRQPYFLFLERNEFSLTQLDIFLIKTKFRNLTGCNVFLLVNFRRKLKSILFSLDQCFKRWLVFGFHHKLLIETLRDVL